MTSTPPGAGPGVAAPFTCTLPVRATDYGSGLHLDNISFQEFVQESRELFLRTHRQDTFTTGVGLLLRTVHLDYLTPVPLGVHEVTMDVVCTRIGRTSFALRQSMTVEGRGEVFTAEVVHVAVGPQDTPVPVPDGLRAALATIAVGPGTAATPEAPMTSTTPGSDS